MGRLLCSALVLGLLAATLAACADGDDGDDGDDGEATTTTTEPPGVNGSTEAEPPTGVALPATPAGDQLAWVLDEAATADDAALAERFSADFLAQVPAAELRRVLGEVGTLTVTEVRTDAPLELVVLAEAGDGTALAASIAVEAEAPHRIVALLFQPAELPASPASWEEVDERLAALPGEATLLAAEVADDGTLTAVHDRSADGVVPIGSAFKLYVLGAVVEAVAAGTLAWDDELTVEEADRSLPSGRLQDEVGSTVTVEEAATLMISISDNTATDLLIRTVGREAVEAVLEPMGMGEEARSRTLPFPTTRELFIIKWGVSPEVRTAYAEGTEAERRALLAGLPDELPSVGDLDPTQPVEVDRIEWFASPRELAAAHVFLDERRVEPGLAVLGDVLGANPGLPLDPATWTRVAFKGGSEPGVLAASWLLERADARRFVVATGIVDPGAPIDEAEAIAIAAGAIALLATG